MPWVDALARSLAHHHVEEPRCEVRGAIADDDGFDLRPTIERSQARTDWWIAAGSRCLLACDCFLCVRGVLCVNGGSKEA